MIEASSEPKVLSSAGEGIPLAEATADSAPVGEWSVGEGGSDCKKEGKNSLSIW